MKPARLEQRRPRVSQTFEILDESLAISFESSARTQSWKVPLAALNPDPVRFHRRPVALIALAPFIFGFLFWMGAVISSNPFFGDWGFFALIGAAPVGMIIMALIARSPKFRAANLLTFQAKTGHGVGLWFENPNKEEFDRFVESLKAAIAKSRLHSHESSSSIATEIQKLKLLFDDGTINAEQFEAAKNKIVGIDRPGKIGF